MKSDLPARIVEMIRSRTPARLLAGHTGGAYRTATQLELRAAHAAARDAVRTDFDLRKHLGRELIEEFGILEAHTQAMSKDEYLLRPDLGRRLSVESRKEIESLRTRAPDLQIVIGDGLSTTAITTQVPSLLPLLVKGAMARQWSIGKPIAVHFCRVGVLNDVGDLLHPRVAVLLIGERPGLATAESLSAYMAYRPRARQTDADRNLISNIHSRGIRNEEAATRILNLAAKMMSIESSGVSVREELPDGNSLPAHLS